ncbi:hypothetical protein HON01_06955, partial [Candidatus Woesearchaeota archaeon]|nr:hypothetical protein [Candidatus Woesearchaeota archaeon]
DLKCAERLLEKGDEYAQLVSSLDSLKNTAYEIKDNLERSLNHASKVAREGSNYDAGKGVLDIIISKQIWMQESIKKYVDRINQTTEDVPGVKLNDELGLTLRQLNAAINECYTNTNIFRLFEATGDITKTINEINSTIMLGHYHSYSYIDDTANYIATLRLIKENLGTRGVKVKIDKTRLTIKKLEPINDPKKRNWKSMFGLKEKKIEKPTSKQHRFQGSGHSGGGKDGGD